MQALERTLADVAAFDPLLNATCWLDADLGRREAAALDAERASPASDTERAPRCCSGGPSSACRCC